MALFITLKRQMNDLILLQNFQSRADLLNRIYSVIQSDPLTRFPVSKPHKRSSLQWLCKTFAPISPIPKEISDELSRCESENDTTEPEYIFKTFDRGGEIFVTLVQFYQHFGAKLFCLISFWPEIILGQNHFSAKSFCQ